MEIAIGLPAGWVSGGGVPGAFAAGAERVPEQCRRAGREGNPKLIDRARSGRAAAGSPRLTAKLAALMTVALAVGLAGCGASGGAEIPDLRKLPLVDGAHPVAQSRVCDRGASAFCAFELVLVDPRYATSAALVAAERTQLRRHGWTGANGDTGDERAADSPGGKLRVTYATAYGELKGIIFGWVKRSRTTTLALSRAMFARASTMSILLEVGPS